MVSKKSTPKRRRNRKAVMAVCLIAAIGLVLTSSLGYLGYSLFSPGSDSPVDSIEDYIVNQEYRVTQYVESLQKSPENINLLLLLGDTYYNLGSAYEETGNFEKAADNYARAVEPYGKVLELDPGNVDARVDRAVAAFQSGSYELAGQEFETAIETAPEHAQAHFNYGVFLYSALNKPAEAVEMWKKVIELNPPEESQLVTTARTLVARVEEEMQQAPVFELPTE